MSTKEVRCKTCTGIAEFLKSNWVPTPSGKSCKWTKNTAYSILTNEKYKGTLSFRRNIPPIILNIGWWRTMVSCHSIMSRKTIMRLSSVKSGKWCRQKWCAGLWLEPIIRATRDSPRNWYAVIAASYMGRKSGIRQANTQRISTDATQNTTNGKHNAHWRRRYKGKVH